MADEAVLMWETEPPVPMTVANATAITKGAVLKLTDPNTAIINSGENDMIAGIAAADKIASDGVTKLAVYRGGIFRLRASGSITVGDPVSTLATYTNYVASRVGTLTLSGSRILGVALETATNGETLLVELRPSFGFVAV